MAVSEEPSAQDTRENLALRTTVSSSGFNTGLRIGIYKNNSINKSFSVEIKLCEKTYGENGNFGKYSLFSIQQLSLN